MGKIIFNNRFYLIQYIQILSLQHVVVLKIEIFYPFYCINSLKFIVNFTLAAQLNLFVKFSVEIFVSIEIS